MPLRVQTPHTRTTVYCPEKSICLFSSSYLLLVNARATSRPLPRRKEFSHCSFRLECSLGPGSVHTSRRCCRSAIRLETVCFASRKQTVSRLLITYPNIQGRRCRYAPEHRTHHSWPTGMVAGHLLILCTRTKVSLEFLAVSCKDANHSESQLVARVCEALTFLTDAV